MYRIRYIYWGLIYDKLEIEINTDVSVFGPFNAQFATTVHAGENVMARGTRRSGPAHAPTTQRGCSR